MTAAHQLDMGQDMGQPKEQWWCPRCDQTYPAHEHENIRNCAEHWPFTPMERRRVLQEDEVRAVTPLVPRPRARNADPETSHAAAQSVSNLRKSQEAILWVFRWFGPMTDEELVRHYMRVRLQPRQSESGIRTRRRELVDMDPPLIVNSGAKKKMDSGRMAVVWRLP